MVSTQTKNLYSLRQTPNLSHFLSVCGNAFSYSIACLSFFIHPPLAHSPFFLQSGHMSPGHLGAASPPPMPNMYTTVCFYPHPLSFLSPDHNTPSHLSVTPHENCDGYSDGVTPIILFYVCKLQSYVYDMHVCTSTLTRMLHMLRQRMLTLVPPSRCTHAL